MFKTSSRAYQAAWMAKGAGGSSRTKRVWFACCWLLALSLIFSGLHGQGLAQDPDLVAYYPFNGNADDASGNGHHGNIYGSPNFTTTEDGRTIISLNGVDSYVQLPDESSFDLTEFTISVTIRVPDYSRTNWIIFKGPYFGNFTMNIFGGGEGSEGRAQYAHQFSLGNYSNSISEGQVPVNTFVKLAVTVSSTNREFKGYCNGHIVSSYSSMPPPTLNDSFVIIGAGRYLDESWKYFKGDIDEVIIFKRVLTTDEIEILHSGNRPPSADAGPDLPLTILGSTVQLQGTAYDPDPWQILKYSWTFKSYPGTSEPVLKDPTTLTPSFVAADHGDYELELKVTDSAGASATDTVKISFNNLPPVADAGPDQVVTLGYAVSLDGVGSSDPNHDPLVYEWSLSSKPADSEAWIVNANSQEAWFYPDVPGQYEVQLRVSDGYLSSPLSSANIKVKASQGDVAKKIEEAIKTINVISKEYWVNANYKKTMVNKAVAVGDLAADEQYVEAVKKIDNDIQRKLKPEEELLKETAWITDPVARKMVYDKFECVKTYLKSIEE